MSTTLSLMNTYAKRRRIKLSTLGKHMIGSSTLAERLAEGRVQIVTIRRVEQWLSDHWPDDLDWPAEVERPEPAREDAA